MASVKKQVRGVRPIERSLEGRDEVAVYRPTTAEWFVQANTGVRDFVFGQPGVDVPLPSPLAYRYGGRLRGASVRISGA